MNTGEVANPRLIALASKYSAAHIIELLKCRQGWYAAVGKTSQTIILVQRRLYPLVCERHAGIRVKTNQLFEEFLRQFILLARGTFAPLAIDQFCC